MAFSHQTKALFCLLVVLASIDNSRTAEPSCPADCKCNTQHGMATVSCVELSLKNFPGRDQIPYSTISIDLSRNDITELGQLEDLADLKYLTLAYNKINNVSANTFDKYNSLEQLDLSNNEINKLVAEVFNGLENLKVLNISNNYLRSLPDNVFYNLPALVELHLTGNPLRLVRYELFRESELLKILDISNTGLNHLEASVFHSLSNLEYLDISGNHFEKVPKKALASVTKLKHLKLNRNSISLLSDGDFKKLVNLETLEISDIDALTTIESGTFSGLKSLKVLRINSNPSLHTLNFGAFEGLYFPGNQSWSLKELYLRQNGLKTVDAPSSALCGIEILDLQQNPWSCDCNLRWITHCVIRIELTTDLTCAKPNQHNGKLIRNLDEEDLICISQTLLEHQQKILRIVVITSGIVGIFLCGLIIAVVFKRHKLMEWWSYRKRGSGAVYYVKAENNPNEP